MPHAVRFGPAPYRTWPVDPVKELSFPEPVEPVFAEPLGDVEARIRKRVGKVVFIRALDAPHPDIAKLLVQLANTWQGLSSILLRRTTLEDILTPQNGGPYGLGAALAGDGASLVLMKRGQNIGYQGYLILYPATGQGMVVMTNSDNGSRLAEALIRRAALAYGWPELPPLAN